jgi:anti-anti-sigma factor
MEGIVLGDTALTEALTVDLTVVGCQARVTLVGDLTGESEGTMRLAVRTIDLASTSLVELDMSRVDRIDSAGLVALLRVRARLADNLVLMVLVSPSAPVRRTIQTAPVEGVFDIIG